MHSPPDCRGSIGISQPPVRNAEDRRALVAPEVFLSRGSSDLLKESPEVCGSRNQLYGGLARRVPPRVFGTAWYMDEPAWLHIQPFNILASLGQRLNSSREQKEVLGIGMAVKWHCEAWGHRADHHAITVIRFPWQSQKLDGGSKHIKNAVRSSRHEAGRCMDKVSSLHGIPPIHD